MILVVSTLARSLGAVRTVGAVWISTGACQPPVTRGAEVGISLIAVEQTASPADLTDSIHMPNLSVPSHGRAVCATPAAVAGGTAHAERHESAFS